MSDERSVWIGYLRARNCEISLRASLSPRRERVRELTDQYSLDYWAAKSEELLRKKKVPASFSVRTLRRMRNGGGKHSVMHLIALAIVLECEFNEIVDPRLSVSEKGPCSKALADEIDCPQQEVSKLGSRLPKGPQVLNEADRRSRRVLKRSNGSLVQNLRFALGIGFAFWLGFMTSINLSETTQLADAGGNLGWTLIDPGNDARIFQHVGLPGRAVCIQAIDAATRQPARARLWRDADPGGKKDLDTMTGSRTLETKGFRYSVFVHNPTDKPIFAAPCGVSMEAQAT